MAGIVVGYFVRKFAQFLLFNVDIFFNKLIDIEYFIGEIPVAPCCRR